MHPGCGRHQSFCCPSECYKFNSSCDMVNHPSCTSYASCDPCRGQQSLCGVQSPAYTKFSQMPLPLSSIAPATNATPRSNTKLSNKASKIPKDVEKKLTKGDEQGSDACKRERKKTDLKIDLSKIMVTRDDEVNVTKGSKLSTLRNVKSNDKVSGSRTNGGPGKMTPAFGDDKGSYEHRYYPTDKNEHILKTQSSGIIGYNDTSMTQKLSQEEVFDIITDDNVVIRSQCKFPLNVPDSACGTCKCDRRNSQTTNSSNKCSQLNQGKTKMYSNGFCNNIKINGLSSTHCCWGMLEKENSESNLAMGNPRLKHKFGNGNGAQRGKASTSDLNRYSSKSCSHLKSERQMEVIDEECEVDDDCGCNAPPSSSIPVPPSKYSLNPKGCNPFADDYHSQFEKPIEESCADFLNIISDNILESVENSVNGILRGYCGQTSQKINELYGKLERNETMMSRLYCGIMEKMAEQNENSLRQFRSILEFLMENEANKEQPQSWTPINSQTCNNKECQCDLYATEMVAPGVYGTGKPKKYCCFATDDDGDYIADYRRRSPIEGNMTRGNFNRVSRSSNNTTRRRCCCCDTEMPERNGLTPSQTKRNSYWGMERSLGGGIASPTNKSNVGGTKNDYHNPRKCCCGHSQGSSACSNIDRNYGSRISDKYQNIATTAQGSSSKTPAKIYPTTSSPSSHAPRSLSFSIGSNKTNTNQSTGLNDYNTVREDDSLCLGVDTDEVVHMLDQCQNSFQTCPTDDHDTSGYATEPEDNADDLSRGGGSRKKLSSNIPTSGILVSESESAVDNSKSIAKDECQGNVENAKPFKG